MEEYGDLKKIQTTMLNTLLRHSTTCAARLLSTARKYIGEVQVLTDSSEVVRHEVSATKVLLSVVTNADRESVSYLKSARTVEPLYGGNLGGQTFVHMASLLT